MGRQTKWSELADGCLRAMWARNDQYTVQDIADRINRDLGTSYTASAVTARRAYIKLPPKGTIKSRNGEWSAEQVDTLYREWERGTHVKTIALMCRKTKEQVVWKRQYCGLPPRKGIKVEHLKSIHLKIPRAVFESIDRAAKDLDMSKNEYLRSIIEPRFTPSRQTRSSVASFPDHRQERAPCLSSA